MKRGNKAKSIMVDFEEANPRKPKGTVLIRTLRGVRK